MEPEKTPGSDGIPAEFYKIFRDDISEHSINYAYQKEQFSVTRRRGIIKLIPKKIQNLILLKTGAPLLYSTATIRLRPKLLLAVSRKYYQNW